MTYSPEIQIAMLIEERTGIAVQTKLQHVFQEILRTLADGDTLGLLKRLTAHSDADSEWQRIIHALTIGETYFMREHIHFDLLRHTILPALIAKRREKQHLYLNVWSAGCASGEEIYSLAIILHQLLPDISQWHIHLLGTDLNAHSLAVARAGVYREWSFRQVDEGFKHAYFENTPQGWRIKPFITQMVTLRHANLLEAQATPAFDLILCRNVLLYFSPKSVMRAGAIFHQALATNGVLLLGHTESLRQPEYWVMELHQETVIYKKALPVTSDQLEILQILEEKPHKHLLLQSVYEQAVNAVQSEQYAQAEALIQELLGIEPHNSGGHLLMAVVYANRKAYPQAHAHLDVALEYNPLLADAHYIRAMLHWEREDLAQAGESLRAALYCQRNHPLASWMMGDYHAKMGAEGRAFGHWQNAQRAIKMLLPECFVCAVSPMLAGQLQEILNAKLQEDKT